MSNKRKSQWQTFVRLISYLKPYKWQTLFALAFMLGTTGIQSYIPLVARDFIDRHLSQFDSTAITFLIAYYCLYVAQSLIQFAGKYLFSKVSYSIVRDIRQDAFSKAQYLGMSYYDKNPAGAIVSKMTNDTESVSEMFSGLLSSFISAIFVFFVTLFAMLRLNWRLTGIVVLLLPVIFILVNVYRRRSIVIIDKTRSLLGDINTKLSESIEGITIVQAFRQEERLKKEFEQINEEHLHFATKSTELDSLLLRPAMSLLKLLAYALLVAYFGLTWRSFAMTAGTMYAFIQYVNRLFDPLIEVTQSFSTLQTSMVSAARVFELIDDDTKQPSQTPTNVKVKEGNIEFNHVSFSYDGKRQVLDDISFKVNKGETIAFVGATGSGKSSIINVFMRFYDYTKGQVLIDGIDIKKYSKEELSQSVGLVLQEPFLYHGTVRDNIAMYQDISDEEVKAAAEFVDANEFIEKLEQGYEEPVAERGSTFSTGQRQLLAFARTIATEPKILILDEATANIDSETEQMVQKSLDKMRKGRTTIAIAHRLSTIQDANCIYVLDKGKIIESGTHNDLLAKKGQYYRMYKLQAGMI